MSPNLLVRYLRRGLSQASPLPSGEALLLPLFLPLYYNAIGKYVLYNQMS